MSWLSGLTKSKITYLQLLSIAFYNIFCPDPILLNLIFQIREFRVRFACLRQRSSELGTGSEQSVYLRYFHLVKLNRLIAHERLTPICFVDYDRDMALVVDYKNQ